MSESLPAILVVPGDQNSGPDHWQSLWERKHPGYRRAIQRDWDRPRCDVFADRWGSRFLNIGPAGHINTAAGFGPWPEGETLLETLRKGRAAGG